MEETLPGRVGKEGKPQGLGLRGASGVQLSRGPITQPWAGPEPLHPSGCIPFIIQEGSLKAVALNMDPRVSL